jgi:hypothetical protein
MRPQRTLVGAAALALILGGQALAKPAAATAGGDEAGVQGPQLERLAQRDDKSTGGPEPDPGGLPGFRREMPSAPAARPAMPESFNAPRLRGTAPPADAGTSGSSKSKEDKKKTEPK